MSLDYSIVDLVAAFVVLASTVYATWKGFISETLSIVAWAVAAFASLYLGPLAGDRLYALISPPWLASLAGYAIVFLVVLIPLSLASSRLAQSVQHSPVGFIDRVLGMAFGVVRGVVVLGLAYLVFTAFVPIRSQPKWLTTARALPLIQSSSEVLLSLVPNSHAQDVVPLTRKAQNLPDRKSTRLNSSHMSISYAVFCLKKKNNDMIQRKLPPAFLHQYPCTIT